MANKRYLIFGGTGSLGTTLTSRLNGNFITVFSRDEAKHHKLRLNFPDVKSIIGDIRDYDSVLRAIRKTQPDIIVNAAAMKQVPACEEYPYESVLTNIIGTQNLIKALEETSQNTMNKRKVLSISTDKVCKPVNSYGMTKALQERIHLRGESDIFNCVRYGNVLESTGSVLPVFKKLLTEKKDLTVTDKEMTRFFLSLNESVNLIFMALDDNEGGKIFIPKIKSAKIVDLAQCMIEAWEPDFPAKIVFPGIRPGEKLDELLISEEETARTEDLGECYVIHDIYIDKKFDHLSKEYSSKDDLMVKDELKLFLNQRKAL